MLRECSPLGERVFALAQASQPFGLTFFLFHHHANDKEKIAQSDEIQRGDNLSPDRQLQLLVLSYLSHMHAALWRDQDSAHEQRG
jgi:hypothetical protein